MKKFLSLIFAALISTACTPISPPTNTNNSIQNANAPVIVSSHSTDLQTNNLPPPNKNSTESSPMARPIDVTEMNAAIEKAEKNPKDKKALAKAYFTRAFALTEAAQYRSALGDFRKGLKLDPNDEDAKKMHDEILRIFKSINREPPKEGEEPAPLQFNKEGKQQ